MKKVQAGTSAKAQLRAKGFVPAVEAAEKLGFSAQSVYDWMDSGKVAGVRLGKARWIEWRSVVAYFKGASPEAAKLAGIA
jgi:hypothetical protein